MHRVCPECNAEYEGRRKTCSSECAKKRAAKASAEAASQIRQRSGVLYERWRDACTSAAKVMAESGETKAESGETKAED